MRISGVLAFAGLSVTAMVCDASARTRHRHRVAHVRTHQFVYPTPDEAARAPFAGQIGGFFETGIPGATTADPYERPTYGYDARGRYGPGYVYPE